MQKKTLRSLGILLGMLSICFSSCSIEKRHYRGGYYIYNIKHQENEFASTEKRLENNVSAQDYPYTIPEEQVIYTNYPDTREEGECCDDSSICNLQNDPAPRCGVHKLTIKKELTSFYINDTLQTGRKIKIAGNRNDHDKSNALLIGGIVLLATTLILFTSGWWFLHGLGLVIAAGILLIATFVFGLAITIKDRSHIHNTETQDASERSKMNSAWTRRGKLWFWIFNGLLVLASVGMMLYVIQGSFFMLFALITGLLTFPALIIALVTNRTKLGVNDPVAFKSCRRRRLMSIIEMIIAPLAVLLSIIIALFIGFS